MTEPVTIPDKSESKVHQPIICIDFDGVLHSYLSGWQGPRCIPDPPVSGAIEWLKEFLWRYCDRPEQICCMAPPGEFKLAIFSSRSRYIGGRRAMKKWLIEQGVDRYYISERILKFPLRKPPALLTIDDRAWRFVGVFPTIEEIRSFKPWNKQDV